MKFEADLLNYLRRGPLVTVLTGAGISAESGVPTFRDAIQGVWHNVSPLELATPQAFQSDPKRVWDWYAYRRELVKQVEPNAGHKALVELAKIVQLTLITQNVDGLHQLAGSHDVIELHGNIRWCRCSETGERFEQWDDTETPPRNPRSGAYLRPDVVWFDERLPANALNAAYDAAKNCEIFLSIGTSSQVYPAADLPKIALAAGATVIEINKSETPLSRKVHHCWRGSASEILSALVAAISSTG